MNRWADLLASFGMATLLHGLLVLGAVWFWTLRPPEVRPVFQDGDVSLAVTFLAAAGAEDGQTTADGRQIKEKSGERTGDGRQTTEERGEWAEDGEARGAAEEGNQAAAEIGSRKPETTEILTDPETEMPEDKNQTTDDRRQTKEDGRLTTDDGQQKTDTANEPPAEDGEEQDMLDAEAVAPASAQASVNAPEDGLPADLSTIALAKVEAPGAKAGGQTPLREAATAGQAPDDGQRTAEYGHQGVSGAVRMQSEIRPYYPLGARLRGEEGAVTVRVWVKPSGRASRSEVIRSSGFPVLDEAAMDAARRARYVSTRPGAWRAEAETTLTFRFRLTE